MCTASTGMWSCILRPGPTEDEPAGTFQRQSACGGKEEEIVIGDGMAKARNLNPGDTVEIIVGKTVPHGDHGDWSDAGKYLYDTQYE